MKKGTKRKAKGGKDERRIRSRIDIKADDGPSDPTLIPLPLEIWERILFFAMRWKPWRDIVTVMLVCREWQQLAWGQIFVFDTRFFKAMPPSYLHVVSLNAAHSLKALSVMATAEDSHLSAICKLTSLTTLDVSQCTGITTKGLSCLSSLSFLTTLNASYCPKISDRILNYLTESGSHLATLKLKNCTGLRNVGLRKLSLLASLTALDLQQCTKVKDCGIASVCRAPSLKSLNLLDCSSLTVESLKSLRSCSSLVDLNIGNCHGIIASSTPADFFLLPPSLTRLSLLNLCISNTHLQHMTRLASLSSLALHCQSSEVIMDHLSHFTKLDDIAVVGHPNSSTLSLVSALPSLRSLTLSCQMSRDGLRILCESSLTSSLTALTLQGCGGL